MLVLSIVEFAQRGFAKVLTVFGVQILGHREFANDQLEVGEIGRFLQLQQDGVDEIGVTGLGGAVQGFLVLAQFQEQRHLVAAFRLVAKELSAKEK